MPDTLSDVTCVSTIRNTSGFRQYFAFLGDHGITLNPNEEHTLFGDLFSYVRDNPRKRRALEASLLSGAITIVSVCPGSGGGSDAISSALDIPGCQLWIDASQITGLSDDDAVATWPDFSGNGFSATQAVANNRPKYKTGILNGLPVVRFDQSVNVQYLALSGDALSIVRNIPAVTVAGVLVNVNSIPDTYAFQIASGTVAANQRLAIEFDSGAVAWNACADDGTNQNENLAVQSYNAVVGSSGVFAFVASLHIPRHMICLEGPTVLLDNASPTIGSFTDTGNFPDTAALAFNIGACTDGVPPSAGFKGDIGELAFYNRASSARERRQLLEYLSVKWGTL